MKLFQPATAKAIAERFQRIKALPAAQRAFAVGQWVLLALIVAYLVWRLSGIGWRAVIENLPASPWFYALLVLKFLTLPVAETFVYQIIWERPLFAHFAAFVRKRVYNNAVAGYSGEAFLALWARLRLGLSDLAAVVAVKDANILSAFTANAMTVLLILGLAVGGTLTLGADAIPGGRVLFGAAFVAATAFAVGVIALRKRIIALAWRKSRAVLAVHAVRQAAQMVIYAALYAVAIPSAPLSAWFIFIALQYVVTRIPFLPNQELVYLGAALSLSAIVGAPEEAVAGMLLAEGGLLQALYFVLFFATAHLAGNGRKAAGAQSDAGRKMTPP